VAAHYVSAAREKILSLLIIQDKAAEVSVVAVTPPTQIIAVPNSLAIWRQQKKAAPAGECHVLPG
jgi:hypothetical protein